MRVDACFPESDSPFGNPQDLANLPIREVVLEHVLAEFDV